MTKGEHLPGDNESFKGSGDGGGALIGDLFFCFLLGGISNVEAEEVDSDSSLKFELDEFSEERIEEFFSFSPLGEDLGDGVGGVGDDGEYVGEIGGGDHSGVEGVKGGPDCPDLTGDKGGGGHVGDDGIKGGPEAFDAVGDESSGGGS